MAAERIAEIKFKEEYLISILLEDGQQMVYDMKPRLVTARFRDLADWDIFSMGKVVNSSKVIKWNDNTEISIEEIMLQAKDN